MADAEQVTLSPAKAPSPRSIEVSLPTFVAFVAFVLPFDSIHNSRLSSIQAFEQVSDTIKKAIIDSRKHWDSHEPRMWSKAKGIKDDELVNFDIKKDLVLIRAGVTTYGTMVRLMKSELQDSSKDLYAEERWQLQKGLPCPPIFRSV